MTSDQTQTRIGSRLSMIAVMFMLVFSVFAVNIFISSDAQAKGEKECSDFKGDLKTKCEERITSCPTNGGKLNDGTTTGRYKGCVKDAVAWTKQYRTCLGKKKAGENYIMYNGKCTKTKELKKQCKAKGEKYTWNSSAKKCQLSSEHTKVTVSCNIETAVIPMDNCNSSAEDPIERTAVWALLLLVINIMTVGVGILAVAGIVYGSILYASASGSAEQVKKARTIIMNVVIGIIAFGLMYALLQYIIPGGLFT